MEKATTPGALAERVTRPADRRPGRMFMHRLIGMNARIRRDPCNTVIALTEPGLAVIVYT